MSLKIRLKNSVLKDKAPLPGDLDIGEVAINAHQDSVGAYIKDASGAIRKIAGVGAVGGTDATTAAKGIVQLADAAAITAGTAGRVVDAAQLKAIGGTDATTAVKGIVQLADAAAITAGTAGRIVDAAQLKVVSDADDWTRTGTTIAPRVTGDVVEFSGGTVALPGLTPVGDPNTGIYSAGADEFGIATNGIARLLADATGGVTIPGLSGASIANLAVSTTGQLIRQALPFSWDANDDSYSRIPVADRSILVQARMKRCLVTDAGVVTYLDADDSTKLAGDWVRLVETTELSAAYTGTHGAEVANTELRELASAWAAGTFTKGKLVSNGGFVWECVAATTTATPAAGTAAATLTGATAQVMVEIPLFSVKHSTNRSGTYKRHEFTVASGAVTTGGFAVHPAFVKPDGSFRNSIYVGAYKGTGTSGNGSASGVNNTTNMTRGACRAACAGRGAGWHQLGYWELNALQWLLITEYQDMNSQRVLGNGAMTGGVYVVPSGLSNVRGNRSGQAHTVAGANSDYVSYRGVENLYGRAWQWVDGFNLNERNVYLCNDPSKWADNTTTGYIPMGAVPAASGGFQRDLLSGIALLPSSVTGASDTTYTGDGLWIDSGWRVAVASGDANSGGPVGALFLNLVVDNASTDVNYGGRLCYAA
jgi:hypothetical protein